MSAIELNPADYEVYKVRREMLEAEFTQVQGDLQSIEECVSKLSNFAIKAQSRIAKVSMMR